MAKNKVPMRKCVVTGEMRPKKEMVRIVKTKENEIFIDETGKRNGRGAYVSLDAEVIQQAKAKDILSGVLKTNVTDEFYDELLAHVNYRIARIEIMKQNEQ
ncbi:YlxR family protein [Carnobacteriaceae bacterium 52-44]|jgi:Predicted nucleic-acid-binding protein implicated in transcription termination